MAYSCNRVLPSLFLAILLALCARPAHAETNVPSLAEFIEQVRNGDAEALRGMYVPGLFASLVTQQPKDDPAFVSSAENTLTQFGLASRHGSTGLLAHNSAAGKDFSLLEVGQVFYLIYGNGSLKAFRVTRLQRVRALNSKSTQSNFIDLDGGDFFTAARLFETVYDQSGDVILQTCIESEGDPSWGRLFVIAEPYAGDDPSWLFEPKPRSYVSILKLPSS